MPHVPRRERAECPLACPLYFRMKFTKESILKAVPIKNREAETREGPGKKTVTLALKRRKSFWLDLLGAVMMMPPEFKVELDEQGTRVYGLCDGKNSIEKIISEMSGEFPSSGRRQLEKSVVEYLNMLAKRKIIAFILNK